MQYATLEIRRSKIKVKVKVKVTGGQKLDLGPERGIILDPLELRFILVLIST